MRARDYGQVCGIAHALDLVGERWALLIVRELILGPKRFSDLRRGLPRIPTNVLSSRLKELERGDVIRRRLSSAPGGPVVYELTEYGQELEEIVIRLGLWGAKTMSTPRSSDTLSADSLCLGLRALFHAGPGSSVRARYVVHAGDAVVTATVDGETIEVVEGPGADADLELVADAADLHALLSGQLAPDEAVRDKRVAISGDAALLDRFVEAFSIATFPATSVP